MTSIIVDVNDSNFEQEVIQSDKPVLVDFWAEWCGPCKMIAPILHDIAADQNYASKIKIAKVNVDQSSQAPAKYGIRGIPTLMIFKAGNLVATKVGALSKAQLTSFIDENLG
ncbi:MAG: thioredoxin TrxA [Gammaproteobacteria bacterium]|nr:thioredoxin TrxA [Gammaproteobacteria bacterium]